VEDYRSPLRSANSEGRRDVRQAWTAVVLYRFGTARFEGRLPPECELEVRERHHAVEAIRAPRRFRLRRAAVERSRAARTTGSAPRRVRSRSIGSTLSPARLEGREDVDRGASERAYPKAVEDYRSPRPGGLPGGLDHRKTRRRRQVHQGEGVPDPSGALWGTARVGRHAALDRGRAKRWRTTAVCSAPRTPRAPGSPPGRGLR